MIFSSWLQPESYSAAQDRAVIFAVANGRARVLSGLEVTARSAPDPVWSVNVGEGECVVMHSDTSRIEGTIVANRGGPVNWELDPPPAGQQANVTVGFGPIIGVGAGAGLAAIGEVGRDTGPVGHTGWVSMIGAVVLARVKLVGSSVQPGDVTDWRTVMPLSGKIVSTDPPPTQLMPGGAWMRVE